MPRGKKSNQPKRVTRYTYDDVTDPASPETGHTPRIPEEAVVSLPMDSGWSGALEIGKLPDDGSTVIIDMDPAVDPVLMWAGKRNRREVAVLPLQRTEIVTESRIARIIDRARAAAAKADPGFPQESLFAELEKGLRENDKDKRVEFYTHEEGWKNKLICGDSLQVMESLIHYENLRGKVQMVYIDPPYGIDYKANFQQRIDSTENDEDDRADDVLTIRAFWDAWAMGIHSYLGYLEERLYLCRELLTERGSIFVQSGEDNVHRIRCLMDEVFGAQGFVAQIPFRTKIPLRNTLLAGICDYVLWYAIDKSRMTFHKVYTEKGMGAETPFTKVELPDGTRRQMTAEEKADLSLLPNEARTYQLIDLNSTGLTHSCVFDVEFQGRVFSPRSGHSWKTNPVGMRELIAQRRVDVAKDSLRYVLYHDDFPFMEVTNMWTDTQGASGKRYAVQTSEKVVERCIHMSSEPGDLVLDITSGSGVTALCAERWGRRWIACDLSRVAINVGRSALLGAVFPPHKLRGPSPSAGFEYTPWAKTTLGSISNDKESADLVLVDQPELDTSAIRVCGPLEVMTLGRYSIEDWRGQLVTATSDGAKLENYIAVICRLYRKDVSPLESVGVIHGVVDSEGERSLGISVGPISGRVTARQLDDAAREAKSAGIEEVHILGWAFEANVGEVKQRLVDELGIALELVMIRPDTLGQGLRITQPEMLFSPLALPDVEVEGLGGEEYAVTIRGVAVFDRKRRVTEYKHADSGYVAAWYLDEDYDGDCFVDCQMFFDFKKKPAIEHTLKIEVDPREWKLRLTSDPFVAGTYRRIAIKVVDVFGNESTLVRAVG